MTILGNQLPDDRPSTITATIKECDALATSQLFCACRMCLRSLVVNVKEVSVLFDF